MAAIVKKGVLLAETYEKVQPPPNPTGWWVSEKLDGVRAYWDGRNFYSRNGLLFDAPPWFKAGLPRDSHLDGELWCGREAFERCIGIIKYQKGSTADEWEGLKFLCFDAPLVKGRDDLAYEERVAFIKEVVGACRYAQAVSIRRCEGQAHLDELLKAVLAHGGEGLMLREPRSKYVRVRSKSLLKVKTFVDAEAKVVGYTAGKNRLQGMLGALQCELPLSGVRFEVGTGFTDGERNLQGAKRRHPLGSVVSFKFQNLTKKGAPRFPVFLRARLDKTWDEVVADAQKDIDDAAAGGLPAVQRAPSLMAMSGPRITRSPSHEAAAAPGETSEEAPPAEEQPAEATAGAEPRAPPRARASRTAVGKRKRATGTVCT